MDYPKNVEFYSKNKFEKLVHLIGFIIRIYHDARSPERQISKTRYSAVLSYSVCQLCVIYTDTLYFNMFASSIAINLINTFLNKH